ncbi:MAG: hypothetical protein RI567_09525 [Marinobacter sp.]|nr:hypothetical protein [Marinobacter sp.]
MLSDQWIVFLVLGLTLVPFIWNRIRFYVVAVFVADAAGRLSLQRLRAAEIAAFGGGHRGGGTDDSVGVGLKDDGQIHRWFFVCYSEASNQVC